MDFGTNRVLITGASGWLGKTFIDSLLNGLKGSDDLKPQKNISIKCLLPVGEKIDFKIKNYDKLEITRGDISNLEDCKNFTSNERNAILFHCAGVIHPKRVKEFYDINVKGTNNLLSASINSNIKKIIAISSNSPFGVNPSKNHLFHEEHGYNPYLNYGKSKMLMEKSLLEKSKIGAMDCTILRPPWFYGPHQPNRQIRFYKMIKNGTVPIIGDGSNIRSMACTLNISQAMIRAAISDKVNGETYWIADKRPYSFLEIVDTIRSVLRDEFGIICKNKHVKLPSLISKMSYSLDSLIQTCGFYKKEIHVLSEMNKTIACSINKAENELNYKPKFDLYNGSILSISSALEEIKS